jgi:DNA-binding NarL/FixJ family response regulator
MATPKPSILIIEDEVLIANDIRAHLLKLGYTVAGIAYNSDKASDMMHSRSFDFAVVDINIGGSRDGIQIAELINEKYKKPFIYLTSYSDPQTLARAQTTLPYGYIVKPFAEKDLAATISMALYKFEQENDDEVPDREKINNFYGINLSEKEYEVLGFLLEGKSIQESAKLLFRSDNTVKTHLRRIYEKLDVHNRVELTKKIMETS